MKARHFLAAIGTIFFEQLLIMIIMLIIFLAIIENDYRNHYQIK